MKKSKKYGPVVREREVRLVLEHQREHASQWAAIERERSSESPSDSSVRFSVGGRGARVVLEGTRFISKRKLALVLLLIAALPQGAAGAAYKEQFLLSVIVGGGEWIDGQIYGRISPGNRWVLRINACSFQPQQLHAG